MDVIGRAKFFGMRCCWIRLDTARGLPDHPDADQEALLLAGSFLAC